MHFTFLVSYILLVCPFGSPFSFFLFLLQRFLSILFRQFKKPKEKKKKPSLCSLISSCYNCQSLLFFNSQNWKIKKNQNKQERKTHSAWHQVALFKTHKKIRYALLWFHPLLIMICSVVVWLSAILVLHIRKSSCIYFLFVAVRSAFH